MAYDFKSLTRQADEANNRKKFYTDFDDVDPNILHQISELTEWIRTKGKGSDVREVIAQLFERTWLEAVQSGNANMEVAQARGGSRNLSDRLNKSDSTLSDLLRKLLSQAAQIDNLIANAGDGTVPSELIDARTLADGKSYATTGEAVRAIDKKVGDMPKTIKNIITSVQTGTYWSNRTIGRDGTQKATHADYTSYIAPVEPGSIISSNIEMISPFSHFLDADKKAINTLEATKQSDFSYQVPSKAQWLYVTINKSSANLVIVNHPDLASGRKYESCLPGTILGYEIDGVFLEKDVFATLSNSSKLPKILKNNVLEVFEKTYWSNRTIGRDGTQKATHADYTSYVVKVTPGTKISSNVSLNSPFTHFLDGDKRSLALLDNFVEGSQSGYVYRVPSDAEWLYVTRNSRKFELVAIEGARDLRNISYNQCPAGAFYGFEDSGVIYPFVETANAASITIEVGVNKQYKTIDSALAAVVSSGPNRVHNLLLEDGVYDFKMLGNVLPDYVNLIGVSGNPEKVIIRGEVPVDADDNTITNTSTINVSQNNNFENLTITARNCRYTVHDESGGHNRNWKRYVKNCRIIHYGNETAREYRRANGLDVSKIWQVTRAWGEGASEGAYAQFDNVYFESPVQCWYVHEPNAADSTKPYHHVLNNCTFVSTQVEGKGFGGLVVIDNTRDRGGAVNRIDFNNCSFANGTFSVNGDIPINVTVHGGNEVFISASNPINYPETDYTIKRYYHSNRPLTGGEVLTYSSVNHNFVELATSDTPQSAIVGIHIGTSGKKDDSIRVLMPTLFDSGLTGTFGSQLYVGSDGKLTLTQGSIPVGLYMSGKDKLYKN